MTLHTACTSSLRAGVVGRVPGTGVSFGGGAGAAIGAELDAAGGVGSGRGAGEQESATRAIAAERSIPHHSGSHLHHELDLSLDFTRELRPLAIDDAVR